MVDSSERDRDPKDPRDPKQAKQAKPHGERSEGAEAEGAEERAAREAREAPEARDHDRSFRRLGDSLISSIWGDSSAAFKRGQGLVTGVAQGTKEELVRLVSAEVRGFLDKMDAADLVQEIVSGLVIEMKTEIRFRRSEDGRIEPDIRSGEAKLRHESDEDEDEDDKPAKGGKPGAKAKPGAKTKPGSKPDEDEDED